MTAAPPREMPDSPVDRLLEAASKHRLHIGMTLVANARLTPIEALTLMWTQADGDGLVLHLPARDVPINEGFADLLYWHGCRQRHDARIGGFRWDKHGHVVTNKQGHPYTLHQADAITSRFAVEAGMPPMPMAALRHPVWH